jgi:uncharacterized membrane protein YbhN (UPF0104 family)
LLGGTLVTEALLASALGVFAASLGCRIDFSELLLVNMSVSLLATILPVPGGIGVIEGGLTYGLVGAGMPEETAFAAVLMYRLSTFYLPPSGGSSHCGGSSAGNTSEATAEHAGRLGASRFTRLG